MRSSRPKGGATNACNCIFPRTRVCCCYPATTTAFHFGGCLPMGADFVTSALQPCPPIPTRRSLPMNLPLILTPVLLLVSAVAAGRQRAEAPGALGRTVHRREAGRSVLDAANRDKPHRFAAAQHRVVQEDRTDRQLRQCGQEAGQAPGIRLQRFGHLQGAGGRLVFAGRPSRCGVGRNGR